FGGTSVKTASAMRSAATCVLAHADRHPLVVLSACGGMTNSLLQLARCAGSARTEESTQILDAVVAHHRELCHDLFTSDHRRNEVLLVVDALVEELKEYVHGMFLLCECTEQSLDTVASFGERLSSAIFSAFLSEHSLTSDVLDARSFMKTSADFTRATVDMDATRQAAAERILPCIAAGTVVVTQGFIGSAETGETTTLGRGGSDVSAAILGSVLHAEEIQIWTDVSGVLSADPRVVPEARTLPDVSFSELRDLSFFGAKVLHPDTIKPAMDAHVPVTIRNTFEPGNAGTRAVPDEAECGKGLRAVSARTGCVRLVVRVPVHSSGNDRYALLLDIARRRSCDVVIGTHTDSEVMMVVPEEHGHAFEDVAEMRPADVICVCGPDVRNHPLPLTMVDILTRTAPYSLTMGLTSTSWCAVVDPDTTTGLVRQLHACLSS
ncbi:MAG: aspartate kinase, partial [Candidatus Kapaibacterium sp.]